jgi:hypothetical protein
MKTSWTGAVCMAAMAGCSSPTTPSPPTTTTVNIPTSVAFAEVPTVPPIGAGQSVTVTDGWTGAPVPGARVSVNGSHYLTADDGTFPVTIIAGNCLRVEIAAAGFLNRRTCARTSMTLWPIANEAEMTATHEAAFPFSDRMFDVSVAMNDVPVVFIGGLESRPEVASAWATAAGALASATGQKLHVRFAGRVDPGGDGYLVSTASPSPPCGHAWFTWQFSIAGFCWEQTPEYFVQKITVAPSLVNRSEVALRALLYSFSLRQHQLPGLMNIAQPMTELSLFEKKTLHMMSLRWPVAVKWPDLENVP